MTTDDIRFKIAEMLGWEELKWENMAFSSERQLQGVPPGIPPAKNTGFRPTHVVPAYESDIKAAWEVLALPSIESWAMKWNGEDAEFVAAVQVDGNKWYEASKVSAPLAICLAALKAVSR